MIADRQIKRVRPHVPDCSALKAVLDGRWSTPWWFTGEVVTRDAIGRRHPGGMNRWLVIQCNSTTCDGELLVAETYFLETTIPRTL